MVQAEGARIAISGTPPQTARYADTGERGRETSRRILYRLPQAAPDPYGSNDLFDLFDGR